MPDAESAPPSTPTPAGPSPTSPEAGPIPDGSAPGRGTLPSSIKLMPLGDSLTSGFADATALGANLDGGYRVKLYRRLQSAGYAVDFIGTQANGPEDFDREHESYPGAPIAEIADHWRQAVDAGLRPHGVLLMAGTNDQLGITANQPPEQAAEALSALLTQIEADVPGVHIVLAKPPRLGPGLLVGGENPARMEAYIARIDAVVAAQRKAGLRVYVADLSGVDTKLFGDGVHPTSMAGYDAMADCWYEPVVEAIEGLRTP